ncbi:hypothetical protein EG329_012518 [Mollisiaceae sp. DMI_Dod_QoI]|nr:hypothetical protein EG329_012518 [Helotiales sp. DMI_Dod_QoI]
MKRTTLPSPRRGRFTNSSRRYYSKAKGTIVGMSDASSSDHRDEGHSETGPETMSTVMVTIPQLPDNEADAWKANKDYFKYFRYTSELGAHGWATLDDIDKAIVISTFEQLQISCQEASEPWMTSLLNIINAILDLLQGFGTVDTASSMLAQASSTANKQTKPKSKQSKPRQGSAPAASHPLSRSLFQATKRFLPQKRPRQPSITDATEVQQPSTPVRQTDITDFQAMGSSQDKDKDIEYSLTDMINRQGLNSEPSYETRPDADENSYLDNEDFGFASTSRTLTDFHGSPLPDCMIMDDAELDESRQSALLDDELSTVWSKLGSTRESDPTNYFGDFHPSAATFSVATRTLPSKDLPPRLQEVVEAIRTLDLTAEEQQSVK